MRIAAALMLAGACAYAQAPYERIRQAWREPANWLTYSGSYDAHRYSALGQLTPSNVGRLRPLWVYQAGEQEIEVSPIVVDEVMYISEAPIGVTALDIHTGRSLWSWIRPTPADLTTIGYGRVNRGVAVLDNLVYVGTLDAHLMAFDSRSGAIRWDTVVADYRSGYGITAAPLAINGKVITGVSGGEGGIRGFIDAYDAKSGKRLWRFWTIPAPGEPGHETWAGDSWKTGGGPTWLTGSYDPELNLLYWGTGNPGPDWNGTKRGGDNLYTCSLVALNADTGKLKWHFQFTPHDDHDWDATEIPVLLNTTVRGRKRKVVAMANRNAFYYLLDRATGEFLLGTPFAKQTWAKGLDDHGRPQVLPGTSPSQKGSLVWPSMHGATNWPSPAFNPKTNLFYVPVREMGSYYFSWDVEYKPGARFTGGAERALPADQASGAVRALDVSTGERRWDFRLHTPPWAGLLTTGGGLVFGGTNEGNFFALDAVSGKPLWDFQTGGMIEANPISFAIDGKQVVAITAGHSVFVFGLQ